MKPTIQLINALRKAADRIETEPVRYCWSSFTTCNCGILADALVPDIAKKDFDAWNFGQWSWINDRRCEQTGLLLSHTGKLLEKAGLPASELGHVECLSNRTILERAGLPFLAAPSICKLELNSLAKDGPAVARYFRAWADILEEQLGEQFEQRPLLPVTKPEPVEVV